jgi:hypothetical protein
MAAFRGLARARKIIIPLFSLLRWRLMPRTCSSPPYFYCTAETALVSILCILSTHSWLFFEDEASNRSYKRAIARGHHEVSGDIFSTIYGMYVSSKMLEKDQIPINGAFTIMAKYMYIHCCRQFR